MSPLFNLPLTPLPKVLHDLQLEIIIAVEGKFAHFPLLFGTNFSRTNGVSLTGLMQIVKFQAKDSLKHIDLVLEDELFNTVIGE